MPVYSYLCSNGHLFDEITDISQRNKKQKCTICGKSATKVITTGFSGWTKSPQIWGEKTTWVRNVAAMIQDEDEVRSKLEKPIETRSELKKYMEERGLRFKE